jgi:hypothetical protein
LCIYAINIFINLKVKKLFSLQLLKDEKIKFKEELAAAEMDYRGRLSLLEQQLQKQRERSLNLLEEKEKEIQTLKSTFQMFLPGNMKHGSPVELLDTKVSASKAVSITFNSLCCRCHTYSKNLLLLGDQILPASNVIFHHRLHLLSTRVDIINISIILN